MLGQTKNDMSHFAMDHAKLRREKMQTPTSHANPQHSKIWDTTHYIMDCIFLRFFYRLTHMLSHGLKHKLVLFFFFWCQVKMNCAKMPQPKSGGTPIQPVCRLYLNHFQHLDEKGTAGQPLMFSTVHPFWNPRGTNLMLKKNCAQSLL